MPLPTSTLEMLRQYWATHRHARLLFPADGRACRIIAKQGKSTAQAAMSPTAVQHAIKKITQQIDFGKKVSLHTSAAFLCDSPTRSRRELEGHSEVHGAQ